MGRSRYRFHGNEHPYFVTCTCVGWLPFFAHEPLRQEVIGSLRYLLDEGNLILHAYVIMENHLHLVVSAENPSKVLARFKSYAARQCVELIGINNMEVYNRAMKIYKAKHKRDRRHKFWQEGSHPKAIINHEMFRQKVEYIHNNPVKRGYVDEPIHWRLSSARNYAGDGGILPVERIL